MPVGHAPARPAGQEHGVRLLRPVEGRRHLAEDPRCVARRGPRGRWPRPQSQRSEHRQPEATEIANSRGYDGGKKITGRKRHILVDKLGLLVVVLVSVASADDGTFAPKVLAQLTAEHQTRLRSIWADSKYHSHHLNDGLIKTKVG